MGTLSIYQLLALNSWPVPCDAGHSGPSRTENPICQFNTGGDECYPVASLIFDQAGNGFCGPRADGSGLHTSTWEVAAMPSSELKLTFDAVYYHVTDMERAIAFYRDTLGLRLTSRDYVARFDIDDVLFELVPNAPGNVLPGTGNARLSLGVTDIQQAVGTLQGRGVATTPIKAEPGGLLSYFRDPDGNEICLWQNS